MIVRSQPDLVNAKDSILPVCNQYYHMNKRNVEEGKEIEVLRNYSLILFFEKIVPLLHL